MEMKNMMLSFSICFFASLSAFGQVDTFDFSKNFPPLEIDGEMVGPELANKHIRQGKFFVLFGSLSHPFSECDKVVQKKLGIEYKPMFGCVATLEYEEQIEAYNEVVIPTLNRRFFGDFRKVYEEEVAKCSEEHKFDLWDF